MHRIGGLERADASGHISYDPENHEKMTRLRADKVQGIARDIPEQRVALGEDRGELAVVGWGSTYGAIHQAVRRSMDADLRVSHIHIRHLAPFPANLHDLLLRFDRILVPELNNGQLVHLLRDQYLVPAVSLPKVTGRPFQVAELERAIRSELEQPR
jgi:2-oxoglutarate ferredoxin oxidoreductase subunit alpha